MTVTKFSTSEDSYNYQIVVTNGGGYGEDEDGYDYSPELVIDNLIVATSCGPSSTVVSGPSTVADI